MALARTLMVQGTASSVGKTVLVAGLCRWFVNQGVRVAPFKAQNMALNSFATADGLEIGRAQAIQAQACRIVPRVEMNPILLKPEADHRSQVVLMGKVDGRYEAATYYREKSRLLTIVQAALGRLRDEFDLVLIEGAGSPAEINLTEHDIVNMRVAEIADAPVLLAGDIDRGGLFAALYGTLELLAPADRERVRALVVNKFRGDRALLEPGLEMIAQRTGKPVLGVVPYVPDLGLPEEDSVALERPGLDGPIAVIKLPHISNFDDFDPLPVRYVTRPDELSGAVAIILPGTKATVSDLAWLRSQGLAAAIKRAAVPVAGMCGGFQMLGLRIRDPLGVESDVAEVEGLGLLPVETVFEASKTTAQRDAFGGASARGLPDPHGPDGAVGRRAALRPAVRWLAGRRRQRARVGNVPARPLPQSGVPAALAAVPGTAGLRDRGGGPVRSPGGDLGRELGLASAGQAGWAWVSSLS